MPSLFALHPAYRWPLAAIPLFLLVSFAIYHPAISHYLAFDDYAHIQPLLDRSTWDSPLGVWQSLWTNSGPTGRPIAMGSFMLQLAIPGSDLTDIKIGNIVIHALVGVALFGMCLQFLRLLHREDEPSRRSLIMAGLSALIWLVHPINLTSVAYAIQRMNSLSTLFTLIALWIYLSARQRYDLPAALRHTWPSLLLFGGLATLSKENGVLLPLFILVLELALYTRRDDPAARVKLRLIFIAGAALTVAAAVYVLPSMLHSYAGRTFTLEERVFTELRVLAWYLRAIVMPDIREFSAYHDDWVVSTGLLSPPTTLASLALLIGIAVMVWHWRLRIPLLAAGYLWFLAGHALESTILPLELVFEHRNYLPSFGIILAGAGVIAHLVKNQHRYIRVLLVPATALAALLALSTYIVAQRWADDPGMRIEHLRTQTTSIRSQIELGETLKGFISAAQDSAERTQWITDASDAFERAASIDPSNPDALFGWIFLHLDAGQQPPFAILDNLLKRLSNGPLSATTLNGLHVLTEYAIRKPLMLPDQWVETLYHVAATNPRLRTRGGVGEINLERARFLFYGRGDAQAALELMTGLVATSPGWIQAHVEFAIMLALSDRKPEAMTELDEAGRHDSWGKNLNNLMQLRIAIQQNLLTKPIHLLTPDQN